MGLLFVSSRSPSFARGFRLFAFAERQSMGLGGSRGGPNVYGARADAAWMFSPGSWGIGLFAYQSMDAIDG